MEKTRDYWRKRITMDGKRKSRGISPALTRLRSLKKAVAILEQRSSLRPTLALVLGSGFQDCLAGWEVETEIPYDQLPGFPPVAVAGHAGRVVVAKCQGIPVLTFCGRAHFYEGYSLEQTTFFVRVAAAFGIQDLVLTSAVGGINRRFKAGDLMVVRDHINLMGTNPLRGPAPPGMDRFVDLTRAYDDVLSRLLLQAARGLRLRAGPGVYLAVSGPSYETPAEIRAFARLGADAVGMSVVPEVIVGRQAGLAIAAVSLIANLAAGRNQRPLSHADVLASAASAKTRTQDLIRAFIGLYGVRRKAGLE